VRVFRIPGVEGFSGALDFNPSRVIDPNGYGLCAVEDIPFVARLAWETARQVLSPACAPGSARLTRLDIARDGICRSPLSEFLVALSKVPLSHAKKALVTDPWVAE